MGGILRRIGIVIACVIGGAIVGTIAAAVFGVVKGMLGGGAPADFSGAVIVGIGWFGTVGAIVGALIGRDQAKQPSRAGDVAAWVVAAAAALVCISILMAS